MIPILFARLGARDNVPWICMVITDGEANVDEELTIPEADEARNRDIIMFAVGIGDQVSYQEIQGIANDPDEKFVFNATGFDGLDDIRAQVVSAACEAASGETIKYKASPQSARILSDTR